MIPRRGKGLLLLNKLCRKYVCGTYVFNKWESMHDVCGGIGGARLTGIPIGMGQGQIGSALKGTIGTIPHIWIYSFCT